MSGPNILSAGRLSVNRTIVFQLFIFLIAVYLNGNATSQSTRPKDYSNYTVYRIGLKTQVQLQQFLNYASELEWDIWRDPSRKVGSTDRDADIMVPPEKRLEFLNKMKAIGATLSTLILDVQSKINGTSPSMSIYRRSGLDMLNDPKYFRYPEIVAILQDLQTGHPDKVQLIDIGKSFEGRPMYLVYLSTDHQKSKPAIWIDAGIHAREWIAPSVAVQAIHKLVTDPDAADLLDSIDWFILPVFNPDGYEYSHNVDRMWRKTRSKHPNSKCFGVDANRNFEFYWKVAGASSNPCSDTYAGPTFFSEPETRNARDFLLANKDKIKLYLTYHSYGKYLLYPWGYTHDLPENSDELDKLARDVNKSMVKAGSQPYKIGSSTNVLYAAAGGSDDWAKGVANISLTYTIELPGYGFGFQLPAEYINTVGDHAFVGLREFAKHVTSKNSSTTTNLQSEPAASYNPNGPLITTGSSAASRPIRPKPGSDGIYSNQGGSRPDAAANPSPPTQQLFPSSTNASRPSRPPRPSQTFRPAQSSPKPVQSQPSQPSRPVQSQPSQPSRPAQSQPSQPSLPTQNPWISQPQYTPTNTYFEHQPAGFFPYSYQFTPNVYSLSPSYDPFNPFYSSGYQPYPTVKGTSSEPLEQPGQTNLSNNEQSFNDQRTDNPSNNVKPSLQSSGSTGYFQGASMMASPISPSSPGHSSGFVRESGIAQRPVNPMKAGEHVGETISFGDDHVSRNVPARNPASLGDTVNSSYDELFESNTHLSNHNEGSENRAVGSGSVSFPSNSVPHRYGPSSANVGVSFPGQKEEPRPKYVENPARSRSQHHTAPVWA